MAVLARNPLLNKPNIANTIKETNSERAFVYNKAIFATTEITAKAEMDGDLKIFCQAINGILYSID